MSTFITASEIALTRDGLAAIDGNSLDVIVGGLRLAYTANTVLEDDRVRSLTMVELLDPVADRHVGRFGRGRVGRLERSRSRAGRHR